MMTVAAEEPPRNRKAATMTARVPAATASGLESPAMEADRELLAGIAINGPWKGFVDEARDPKRRHYAWGYSLRTDISSEAMDALKAGDRKRRIKNGTKVYLAYWHPGQDDMATIFRIGYVDYIRRDGHFISFAFHLDDLV